MFGINLSVSVSKPNGHCARPGCKNRREAALEEHVIQIDIESGEIKFDDLIEIGEEIFAARWTFLGSQGRPAAYWRRFWIQ